MTFHTFPVCCAGYLLLTLLVRTCKQDVSGGNSLIPRCMTESPSSVSVAHVGVPCRWMGLEPWSSRVVGHAVWSVPALGMRGSGYVDVDAA